MSNAAPILANQPRPVAMPPWHPLWHWLLLCSPAVALMLSWILFTTIMRAAFPVDVDGVSRGLSASARPPIERGIAQYYFITQSLFFVLLCFGLGSWWRWRECDWGERIAFGFFISTMIFLFNTGLLVGAFSCGFGSR